MPSSNQNAPHLNDGGDEATLAAILTGVRSARSISLDEERALRRWCRQSARQSALSIERLTTIGHSRNARRARRDHLQSVTAHLDALFSASRKRWPIRSDDNADVAETTRLKRLQHVFEALGKSRTFTRPARAQNFSVSKGPGQGHRLVTSFHWVDRARQKVLRTALTPFANLHEAQFMLARDRGRRGPAAVRKALLAAMAECDEDMVFLHFDVKDFYGSISHAWLERELGLPPELVRRHVHTGQMSFTGYRERTIVHASHEATRERGQRGIPQGSALSPLIGEMVIGAVIRSVAVFEDLPIFTWSDNVGVLAPRLREREIVDLARAAFRAHGAGPFELGMARSEVLDQGFNYLGTWYCKPADGDARATIPRQVVAAWDISVGTSIMHAGPHELDQIERHIVAKKAAWGWWDGWPRLERRLTNLMCSARASALCNPLQTG
ncbi:reverse transcriptase domain-containing protein [Novosphingobium mangrovi (ex Hu et al. 2023)]|uniref:Reverse transcriptase domain-containing protein n=1 Tax=Novosphingobium mangrovi (ex Hu et al. 2023) TaxID=2930094 RepID=A0ABT0AEH5_9SPHN|nr:reverse transcriptase domain-containing protein [Novosphingobium mangrovi (ex Hu et al. 2023)]MCJ1961606.1 reverse transcriptase domain-containing protein [Novosphingobium mangrovi (ex Hu et al. 2023)]